MCGRFLGLVAVALGLAGCWIIDEFPPPPPEPSRLYVVSFLSAPEPIDDAPGPRLSAGANVDLAVSDGTGPDCTDAEDFSSPTTGGAGIDNQLVAALVPFFHDDFGPGGIDGQLRDRITSGAFLLLLRVTSRGIVDDSTAELELSLGELTAAPRSALGRLAPAQTVTVLASLGVHEASIDFGHLVAEVPEIPFPLTISGQTFELTLRDVQIEGDVDERSISDAQMGGHVTLDDLRAIDEIVCPTGGCPITIVDAARPDIDLVGPFREPIQCEGMSFGFAFEAVSAVLAEAP